MPRLAHASWGCQSTTVKGKEVARLNGFLLFSRVILALAILWFGLLVAEKSYMLTLARSYRDRQPRSVRLVRFFTEVLAQKKIFHDRYSGLAHFVIFWGFIALTINTLWCLWQALRDHCAPEPLWLGFWLTPLDDMAAILVVIAVFMAFFKRYVLRPARLRRNADAAIILLLILVIVVTDFLREAWGLGHHLVTSYAPLGTWDLASSVGSVSKYSSCWHRLKRCQTHRRTCVFSVPALLQTLPSGGRTF